MIRVCPASFTRPFAKTSARLPESASVVPIHTMLLPHTVAKAHHHAKDRCLDRGNVRCETFMCMIVSAD